MWWEVSIVGRSYSMYMQVIYGCQGPQERPLASGGEHLSVEGGPAARDMRADKLEEIAVLNHSHLDISL